MSDSLRIGALTSLYVGTPVCTSLFPILYPELVAHANNNVEGLSYMRYFGYQDTQAELHCNVSIELHLGFVV